MKKTQIYGLERKKEIMINKEIIFKTPEEFVAAMDKGEGIPLGIVRRDLRDGKPVIILTPDGKGPDVLPDALRKYRTMQEKGLVR